MSPSFVIGNSMASCSKAQKGGKGYKASCPKELPRWGCCVELPFLDSSFWVELLSKNGSFVYVMFKALKMNMW